ncbi:MAG: DUF997 family protein [Verrucomicrobiota bacterium]
MPRSPEPLSESFRQSRREFVVMVVIWSCFAAWCTVYNGIVAMREEDGAELRLILGIPEWVVWGVFIPWLLAVAVTVWFAMCFMKDTDLGGGEER